MKYSIIKFLDSIQNNNGYPSVPGGNITLYGTCYSLLTRFYFGDQSFLTDDITKFIQNCQIETGEFIGPELIDYVPSGQSLFTREHLISHLTCAAIATCLQLNVPINFPLKFAHKFCDIGYLTKWLNSRQMTNAWYEGNNFFIVGQLLVYLRDYENRPDASVAIDTWFNWLDTHIDPKTNLWGSNGLCSLEQAIYGGYHQLLIYFYEDHSILNPEGLVNSVLSLQHFDGSFSQKGNGGACEDVDCVDILVNMYERYDYRINDIRMALRRCLRHILSLQNQDGGFPYNRNTKQSHMGIPDTCAEANTSTVFATWFRVHTIALISQILIDEPIFKNCEFNFNHSLSMGWHKVWDKRDAEIKLKSQSDIFRLIERVRVQGESFLNWTIRFFWFLGIQVKKILRKLNLIRPFLS